MVTHFKYFRDTLVWLINDENFFNGSLLVFLKNAFKVRSGRDRKKGQFFDAKNHMNISLNLFTLL